MFARPELPLHGPGADLAAGRPRPQPSGDSPASCDGAWTAPATRTPNGHRHPAGGDHAGRMRRSASPGYLKRRHDVCMTGVYLRLLEQSPSVREAWLSEHQLRRLGYGDGTCLPDAMVVWGDSQKVIEFGGAYSQAKLAHFHRFCVENALAYEIW